MLDNGAVLFANEAFYLAFANKNFDAMRSIWATKLSVTCIHPGWDFLADRDEVLDSWEHILSSPTPTNITCKNSIVRMLGKFAYVICHEVLDQGFLVATNIFALEDGLWKMIHHQAGAAPPPENIEDEPEDLMQ
jgi:hypothetical protein